MSDIAPLPFSTVLQFNSDPRELSDYEQWWADQQTWLAQHGYMLRARYRKGWVPSWLNDPSREFEAEDWLQTVVRSHAVL